MMEPVIKEESKVSNLTGFTGTTARLERVNRAVNLLQPAEHLRMGVVDGRIYSARADGIAANALLGVIEGNSPRQHHHRALRRGVHRQERFGHQAVDAGDVDD